VVRMQFQELLNSMTVTHCDSWYLLFHTFRTICRHLWFK